MTRRYLKGRDEVKLHQAEQKCCNVLDVSGKSYATVFMNCIKWKRSDFWVSIRRDVELVKTTLTTTTMYEAKTKDDATPDTKQRRSNEVIKKNIKWYGGYAFYNSQS